MSAAKAGAGATASSDLLLLPSSAAIFTSAQSSPPLPGAPAGGFTLPQIRALQRTLGSAVEDRSARLRARVGGSYRELLGTADAIVGMRGDLEAARALLAGVGRRCGRDVVVQGKVGGLARFAQRGLGGRGGGRGEGGEDEDEDEERERRGPLAEDEKALGREARRRLLEAGGRVVEKLLSSGGQKQAKGETGGEAMSRGDALVTAAKALVLCRLLVKVLEGEVKEDEGARDAVVGRANLDQARKKLGNLRRRLLRGIERVLARTTTTTTTTAGSATTTMATTPTAATTGGREDIVKALSAYSLATSSGARDALRHLLHVRGEAMALALDESVEEPAADSLRGDVMGTSTLRGPAQAVLRCLGLFTSTLADAAAVAGPRRLSEALAGLKRRPLMADEALARGRAEALRLDGLARWCGDEVRYYTPFVRHDDLDAAAAADMLAAWARRAGDVLLRGLARAVERSLDLAAVADLRARVLRHWIRHGGVATGLAGGNDMLDQLRRVLNGHLLVLVDAKVSRLRLLGAEAEATLTAWRNTPTAIDRTPGLWDAELLDFATSTTTIHTTTTAAASPFLAAVLARLDGRGASESRARACYGAWREAVAEAGGVVAALRRQRWDTDVDDVEDEDAIDARQRLLSVDDPALLERRLAAGLAAAFAALEHALAALWKDHAAPPRTAADRGRVAAYVLRLLRDVRAKMPDAATAPAQAPAAASSDGKKPLPSPRMPRTPGHNKSGASSSLTFGLSLVPSLHAALASSVAAAPLSRDFSARYLARRVVSGRGLWEGALVGDADLPAQPSPDAFVFLRGLAAAMRDTGPDLWTPAAVRALKAEVAPRMCALWKDRVEETVDEGVAVDNGDGKGNETADEAEDKTGDVPEEVQNEKDEGSPGLTPEQRKDLLVQWVFDVGLLRLYLSPDASVANDSFKELESAILKHTELGADDQKRLAKATQEYFKRTSLLFGLLV